MGTLLNYQAIVLDLDGTLYYQRPVRFCMLAWMALSCFRPMGLHVARLISAYRKLYEMGLDESGRIVALAKRFHMSPKTVQSVIKEWMLEKPLFFVWLFRDRQLIADMEQAKFHGIKLIVLSDYPATEKLTALKFHPDAVYSAGDLGCLKPCPDGLRFVLDEHGLMPSNCLLIGDRMDKDGRLAENIGMDYVILPRHYCRRRLRYGMLGLRF